MISNFKHFYSLIFTKTLLLSLLTFPLNIIQLIISRFHELTGEHSNINSDTKKISSTSRRSHLKFLHSKESHSSLNESSSRCDRAHKLIKLNLEHAWNRVLCNVSLILFFAMVSKMLVRADRHRTQPRVSLCATSFHQCPLSLLPTPVLIYIFFVKQTPKSKKKNMWVIDLIETFPNIKLIIVSNYTESPNLEETSLYPFWQPWWCRCCRCLVVYIQIIAFNNLIWSLSLSLCLVFFPFTISYHVRLSWFESGEGN